MKYHFKDFETGKMKWTRGRFVGFTDKTGLLNVRYAIFQRRSDSVLVPEYLLTPETKAAIEKATA